MVGEEKEGVKGRGGGRRRVMNGGEGFDGPSDGRAGGSECVKDSSAPRNTTGRDDHSTG